MREHFKGVILVILLGLFALAGALISGTQVAYVHEISIVLTLIAVALGYRIYVHGIRSLLHGNVTAQLFATIAIFISVIAGLVLPSASATGTAEAVGYLTAAAIVAFIILAGMTLEEYIIHRTRGALEKLINMSPTTARIRRDGAEVEVPIDEVKLGEIVLVKPGEKIPVEDKSVGIIISNCVINLAPDKSKVFKEAYRVLKNNGKMYVSDIVLLGKLTDEQLNDEDLLSGCVAGALQKEDYLGKIQQAGFKVNIISEDKEISKTQYNGLALESIKIEALK